VTRADPIASAQVILRSESGRHFRGDTAITAENVHEYAPSAEDVEAARPAFAAAGFETGKMVGISFSITAPASTFERFFHAKLQTDSRGLLKVKGGRAQGLELPLNALPRDLAERIVAVTFSPPADLHY
jgi:hypothetical protein